jgi:hypothetical protein
VHGAGGASRTHTFKGTPHGEVVEAVAIEIGGPRASE